MILVDENHSDESKRKVPFIAAINVNNGGSFNGFPSNATRLITPHTRGDLLEKVRAAVADENNGTGVGVYYVNKKTIPSIEPVELQNELASLKSDGYIYSIFDADSPVKYQKIKQTETPQFKHFIKESVVKNPDGTPKIMYRGGDEDIEVFDRMVIHSSSVSGCVVETLLDGSWHLLGRHRYIDVLEEGIARNNEDDIVPNIVPNNADVYSNNTGGYSNDTKITIIDSVGNRFVPVGDFRVLCGSVD